MSIVEVSNKVSGLYQYLDVIAVDGSVRESYGPFPNLITDWGMDEIGKTTQTSTSVPVAFLQYFKWGSGNATPAVTDTALQNQIGQIAATGTTRGVYSASPYGTYAQPNALTAPFPTAEIVAELGFGDAVNVFSRTLVKDALGNPTTIPVQEGERLRVSYRFNWMADEVDGTATISVDDEGTPITTDVLTRAASVTGTNVNNGWVIPRPFAASGSICATFYSGAIEAITGQPSTEIGSHSGAFTLSTYVDGTFRRDISITIGPNVANDALGIKSMKLRAKFGIYQAQFTPPIMKDANTSMDLTWTVKWSRL